MKKLFFFASALALLGTSCSDDLGLKNPAEQVVEGNSTLRATYQLGDEESVYEISDEDGEGVETRTSLGISGSTLTYKWSAGDAIGVYGVATVNGVTNVNGNAYYAYNSNTGAFTGDINAMNATNGVYYGYYPYNQSGAGEEADGGTFAMTFLATQNYNHTAEASQSTYSINPPTGSFSNGVAPAVAVGVGSGNEISMNFQSVGSYVVIPIVNYGATANITSATLQVLNGTGQAYTINGTIEVDLERLAANPGQNMIQSGAIGEDVAATVDASSAAGILTLSMGNGLKLTAGQKTNLWFVIPPNVSIGSSDKIVVKINGKYATTPATDIEAQIEKTFTATSNPNLNGYGGMVGPNQVIICTPSKNSCYPLGTTEDTFVIQNIAQFIEYAYMLSNGDDAAELYSTYKGLSGALQYSSFAQMVALDASGNITGVKNAEIATNLNFTVQEIQNYLAGANANVQKSDYYQAVYGSFISSGSIKPIGGGAFTHIAEDQGITPGSEATATSTYDPNNLLINANGYTLSNLTIAGNGLMQGLKTEATATAPMVYTVELAYATLDNLAVNWTSAVADANPITGAKTFTMLETPSGNAVYNEVTVKSNCTLKNNAGSTAPASTMALFNYDLVSYYTPTAKDGVQTGYNNGKTGVTNQTAYNFAYLLSVDAANNTTTGNTLNIPGVVYDFDFTVAGKGISNYAVIKQVPYSSSTGRNGFGAVLKVNDGVTNAVALMDKINAEQLYSVVDSSTSYWTGKSGSAAATLVAKGTAEMLATVVQNGANNATFNGVSNISTLNLMGSYVDTEGETQTSYWWNGGKDVTMTGYQTSASPVRYSPITVENVYINGTSDGETFQTCTAYENIFLFLNLLGNQSTVNSVYVSGIDIDVTEDMIYDVNAYVTMSAISYVAASGSNIQLSGMTVQTLGMSIYQNVGGLYSFVSANQLSGTTPAINSCVVQRVLGTTSDTLAGYIAGTLQVGFTTGGEDITITNPYMGAEANRYAFGKITVNVDPSANNRYTSSTLSLSGFKNVEEFIDAFNVATYNQDTVAPGYSLYLKAAGTTYLWQASGRGKFAYQGTVNK